MRQPLSEQERATIYQYKLIQKKQFRKESIWSYLAIPVLILIFQSVLYGWTGLVSWLLGAVFVQLIQLTIALLTFKRTDDSSRRWIWRIQPPWIGLQPRLECEFATFRKLHRHLLWLGLCVIAISYPWANDPLLLSLICWHLWVLAPRILLTFLFRKHRPDGVIRLQQEEIAFYHR